MLLLPPHAHQVEHAHANQREYRQFGKVVQPLIHGVRLAAQHSQRTQGTQHNSQNCRAFAGVGVHEGHGEQIQQFQEADHRLKDSNDCQSHRTDAHGNEVAPERPEGFCNCHFKP